MKTLQAIITVVTLLTATSLVANNPKDTVTTEAKTNVMVECKAKVHQGSGYFELRMLNESKPFAYLLIKNPNQNAEVVQTKYGVINTLDTPLLYSFKVDNLDAGIYRIARIGTEYEVLKEWKYVKASNSLQEMSQFSSRNMVQK